MWYLYLREKGFLFVHLFMPLFFLQIKMAATGKFFFFEQEHGLEGSRDFIQFTRGGYKLQRGPLASLAMRNLEFKERLSRITKKHPGTKSGKAIRSPGASATTTSRQRPQGVAAEEQGAYA